MVDAGGGLPNLLQYYNRFDWTWTAPERYQFLIWPNPILMWQIFTRTKTITETKAITRTKTYTKQCCVTTTNSQWWEENKKKDSKNVNLLKKGHPLFSFLHLCLMTCSFDAVGDDSISAIGRFVKLFQIQCLVAFLHIGAQVFFRLFWWDFRWFTFSFTFFGDFSSEIFGDSPFSSPFLVTFPVMNFAIHYIHHRFWWLSCHLFCHFDISLSFYLFWPFFQWPFWQPYKFITIFGASLVTFFVLIFFLPFYSPFLGDFFGDRSFYPTHLSVSLLLC